MDWCSYNNRFLISVNKACHPNPYQFYHMQSPVLRSLWQDEKALGVTMRFSGPRWKSAWSGQKNTIFEWMTQMPISSWCVSIQIDVCCSNFWLDWTVLNPTVQFLWIKEKWEHDYIEYVKDTILMLIRLHLSTQPPFFLMTHRWASTTTRNCQHLKPQQLILLPNPL